MWSFQFCCPTLAANKTWYRSFENDHTFKISAPLFFSRCRKWFDNLSHPIPAVKSQIAQLMWMGYIMGPLGCVNQFIEECNACSWWECTFQNTEANQAHSCKLIKGGHIILALQNTLLVDGPKTIYADSFSYMYRKII